MNLAKAKILTATFAATIQEIGEVPAGHLYAVAMDKCSLAEFESCIAVLVDMKLVKRAPSHLLTWIGGEVKQS
jgi:hypothetical protein